MSFLSILQKIGHGLQVGTAIAAPVMPIVQAIPGAGPIAGTVFQAINLAEQFAGSVQGTGAQKKTAAVALVNAIHPGLNQTVLSDSIDAAVSALNALEAALGKVAPANSPVQPQQSTTGVID